MIYAILPRVRSHHWNWKKCHKNPKYHRSTCDQSSYSLFFPINVRYNIEVYCLVRCEAVDAFEQTRTCRHAFRMKSLFQNLGIQSRMLLRYTMNHAAPSLLRICCEVFSWAMDHLRRTKWPNFQRRAMPSPYIKITSVFFIFIFLSFWRRKADMPSPKHKRQLTTWQVFLSSREENSQPGIEPPTSSLRFGYLSTVI